MHEVRPPIVGSARRWARGMSSRAHCFEWSSHDESSEDGGGERALGDEVGELERVAGIARVVGDPARPPEARQAAHVRRPPQAEREEVGDLDGVASGTNGRRIYAVRVISDYFGLKRSLPKA